MAPLRRLDPLVLGLVAAVATLAVVSVRAAEQRRGLDLIDLGSVVLVAVVVAGAGWWLERRGG